MTIKEFAYLAQQKLQTQTSNSFKRAHIYELLAASFGYNSFAALCVESIFIQRKQETKYVSQNNPTLHLRCIELGYKPAIADVISVELYTLVAEHQIVVVNLFALITKLRNQLLDLDEYENYFDEDDEDNFDEDDDFVVELESIANKDNALAHYVLALIRKVNIDDSYNLEKQGHILTDVEKKWADKFFARAIANDAKYEFHLREAGRLGNEDALLDLADDFDDPSFFETVKNVFDHDPLRASQIAEKMGRMEDVQYWLTIAAEDGDINSMCRLIEEFDQNNLQRCWTWIYLAQLLETDLTKDDFYAIYDGGNMYADGRFGITITSLNKNQDISARIAAQELFKRIEQD